MDTRKQSGPEFLRDGAASCGLVLGVEARSPAGAGLPSIDGSENIAIEFHVAVGKAAGYCVLVELEDGPNAKRKLLDRFCCRQTIGSLTRGSLPNCKTKQYRVVER